MKTAILLLTLIVSTSTFAFGVNLSERGIMSVDELVEIGAKTVQCEQAEPKCILMGTKFGVQYPGQKLEEVELTETTSSAYSMRQLEKIKQSGFCK